eukprot:jgi/Orpsp1_1/1183755/evm.model.c7180000086609.1
MKMNNNIININDNKIILNLKYDIIFKNLFGLEKNKKFTISFLNYILNRTDGDRIVDVRICNPELIPGIVKYIGEYGEEQEQQQMKEEKRNEKKKKGKNQQIKEKEQKKIDKKQKKEKRKYDKKNNFAKFGRVDILIEAINEKNLIEVINIELQNDNTDDLYLRSLYYQSGITFHLLSQGSKYEKLRNVIMINILNYNLVKDNNIKENNDPYNKFSYKNQYNKEHGYENRNNIYFIELKKYNEISKEILRIKDPWILFILDPNDDYFINNKTPSIFYEARMELLNLQRDEAFMKEYNNMLLVMKTYYERKKK